MVSILRGGGQFLRNYMCLKVPSADTVKNSVDNFKSWSHQKKEIVLKKWDSELYEDPVDLVNYWKLNEPSFISNIFLPHSFLYPF